MQTPAFVLPVLMCVMLNVNVAAAADQPQAQQETQTKAQKQERVYGSQLMTREERAEYRAKMRSLKTKKEREALRMEHHKKMQERAREMGKAIPDMPPAGGAGAGSCSGYGPC